MSNEFAAKLYTQYAGTREVTETERRIYSDITPPAPQFIPVGTRVIVNLPDEGEFTGTVLSTGGVDSEFSFTYRVRLEDGMVVGANMGDVRPEPNGDDAITWLLAVRKFGLAEANRMFPEG